MNRLNIDVIWGLPMTIISVDSKSCGSEHKSEMARFFLSTFEILVSVATLFLLLGATCLPSSAETPEQVQQRLEHYRNHDEAAALRRQQTIEWQERRRQEEYARRWKRYGNEEIDVLKWNQQKDGTWVTEFKEMETIKQSTQFIPDLLPPPIPPPPRRLFDQSLDELVRVGALKPEDVRRMRGSDSLLQHTADKRVGVSCASLMINRKPAYKGWGDWVRPAVGSADEQLVIDRCATANP